MADNISITSGSGTTIATDEISGVQYQRVKLSLGADGTAVDAVAGAGAVGTGVMRTTLASDDPLVARMAGAAHDAAIAGSPHRIGGRAVSSNYVAVSTGDTADLVTTLTGSLITKDYSIPEAQWSYAAASGGIDNTATAVTIKAAAAAGLRNYITSLQINHNTLGAATEFAIRDGAGGTVLFRLGLNTTAMVPINITFPCPLFGTAATLLEVVTLTAVTGDVFVNVQGYVAP
jgi:hypothetical protein